VENVLAATGLHKDDFASHVDILLKIKLLQKNSEKEEIDIKDIINVNNNFKRE